MSATPIEEQAQNIDAPPSDEDTGAASATLDAAEAEFSEEDLSIPEEVFVSCTLTLGKPQGGHGPVRRRPLDEFVFTDTWGLSADWAIDPPGTRFTSAGPPKKTS